MCIPEPPLVLGKPVAPSSSRTPWATCATRWTVDHLHSGPGSRSMRHSYGFSTAVLREFQGWNSTVLICTAHTTWASSVTQSSSAVRFHRGKCTRTVSIHGGAPFGSRFWCTFSPVTPVGNRCSMHGRSRRAVSYTHLRAHETDSY